MCNLCQEYAHSMLTPSVWHSNLESPMNPSPQETVHDFPSSTLLHFLVSITIWPCLHATIFLKSEPPQIRVDWPMCEGRCQWELSSMLGRKNAPGVYSVR